MSLTDNTRTKKAALNAVATVLDYAARIIVNFIINPLLLTGLGDFGYGAWQVLGRLMGYISPAGGCPTQALKWTIANKQASTDYEEKRRQVGSAVTVWFIFLPFLSLLGAVLTWYVPGWLNTNLEDYTSIRWAAVLLVANLIFTELLLIPQAVLRGENLGYKRMGLSALFVFIGGGLTAMVIFLKTGIIGVAAANLATTLLTGLLFLKIVKSHVVWFGIAKPAFGGVREYLGLSGWFLVWTLLVQLLRAGDVVVLGLLDSAEQVTHYSLTKFIPETIIGCVAIIVFSITPGLGGIIGNKDFKKATQVRGEIMIFTWLIITVVGPTMLLWNHTFVRLWVGEEYYSGMVSNLLIVIMVTQFVFIRNDANIIDLTLDLKHKVLLGVLSVVISISISAVLIGGFKINIPEVQGQIGGFKINIPGSLIGGFKMGIIGLTLGFIAGQLLLSIAYPVLVGSFLGFSFFSQLKSIFRPAFITVLFFWLALEIENICVVTAWIDLVGLAAVTVGLLSLLTFYGGLTGKQRQNLLSRVKNVL